MKSPAPCAWSRKLNFERCAEFVLHNWLRLLCSFIFCLASPLPILLSSHLLKRSMWSVLHLLPDVWSSFHWEKEISSVQTARPGQQLSYLSPEASHHLSRHCVRTPLLIPHDTLQTMQHVINAIHSTVCSKAADLNICLFCHGLVLSILHVEICPHSTHPIHSITKELTKAMEGEKKTLRLCIIYYFDR